MKSPSIQDGVTLAESFLAAPMTLAESTLERAISVTCAELSLATTEQQRREIFQRIRELHAQRTPAMVERLERERRLTKSEVCTDE